MAAAVCDVAAVGGADDGGLVAIYVEAAESARPVAAAEVEGVAVLEGDLVEGESLTEKT